MLNFYRPHQATELADSVLWLSQSDYSICISLLVEFYWYTNANAAI